MAQVAPLHEDSSARVRILDAAQSLFAQHGFDATATKAIAERARVPSGLIFYDYGNKQGLLKAIVHDLAFLPRLMKRFEALDEALPARAFLLATVRLFSDEFSASFEGMRIVMGGMQWHPEVLGAVRQMRESFSAHVATRLDTKLNGTPLETLDTQLMVKMLFSNVTFLRLVDQDMDIDRQLKGMVDIVLNQLDT